MSPATHRLSFLVLAAFGAATGASAAVSFEKQLWPVLEAKCLNCHKAPHVENGKRKEPKGGLRLDAAWAILKGGETGPAVVPGNLAKSYLHEVVTLPKDDDMFMPPKGDPLTAEEIRLFREWIEAGADFGGWQGNLEGAPAGVAPGGAAAPKVRDHEVFYQKLADGVKPAPAEALEKAKAAGAQIQVLKADGPLLRADFLTGVSKCTDDSVAALLPLKAQLAQLDLGRTAISDAALKPVGQFERLAVLDLRQTRITDAGLAELGRLQHLRSLNLFGTPVSDAGLAKLGALKSLKVLFLAQTQATEAGVKRLQAALPGLQVTLK